MTEYIIATTNEEYAAAANLFTEYSQWLQVDLCFQSFNEELKTLNTMYSTVNGGIVLCKINNTFIACAGIRRIDDTACELKRMWVQQAYQKQGIGEKLLIECIAIAKKLDYKKIRLDTLERLQAAIALYKKYNFVETKPYYNNPNEGVVYMELIVQ